MHFLGLTILTKITCGVGILKRTRSSFPKQSLLTLYQSMIDPYLSYCNTVWGQCNETLLDRLLSLQNKAARSITNFSSDWQLTTIACSVIMAGLMFTI